MTARSLPPFVVALLTALTLALSTTALLAVSASPVHAVKPKNDHAKMPGSCLAPGDLIPQDPTVCQLSTFESDRPTVLLWGDSHAWQMIPALRKAIKGQDLNLVAIVMGGCPPMDNALAPNEAAPACFRSNELALDYLDGLIDAGQGHRVVLAASWQRYRQAIKDRDKTYTGQMARASRKGTPRLMRTLASMNADVDVIGQVATVPDSHKSCRAGNLPYSCDLARSKALPDSIGTKRYLTKTMKPLGSGADLINVNGFFCGAKVCHGLVGRTHTWWDDLHISATMSRKLGRFYSSTMKRADASRPAVPDGDPGCALPIPILC